MIDDVPRSPALLVGHPWHPMLVPFPFVCFVGALLTDIAYWRTASMQWETFSIWLLTAGLVMAAFAVLAGLIDLVRYRGSYGLRPAWPRLIASAIALVLGVVNAFVHSRDGYTSVVPTGLALSVIVVLILLFTAVPGWSMMYRTRMGVAF